MTLPYEEKTALKRSHKFLSSLMTMRKTDFRKMNKEEFYDWRMKAYACLRHYPLDYHIDKMYEGRGVPRDEECAECSGRGFHKMDCSRGRA